MCSVTWKSAVRLVFCGSSEVGSACKPTLRMPPRLGWPVAAAGAVVGFAAGAVVGCAAAVGWAAVVGCAAGAAVGLAAGALVGAPADVGAVGALVAGAAGVPGPHADSSRPAAISSDVVVRTW